MFCLRNLVVERPILELNLKSSIEYYLIEIKGEFTNRRKINAVDKILNFLGPDKPIILDLRDITEVDSTFTGALIYLLKEGKRRGYSKGFFYVCDFQSRIYKQVRVDTGFEVNCDLWEKLNVKFFDSQDKVFEKILQDR